MRIRFKCLVAVIACSAFLSCGSKTKTFDVSERRPERGTRIVQEPETFVNAFAAASESIRARRDAERRFVEASVWLDAAAHHPAPDHAAGGTRKAAPAAASTFSPVHASVDVWTCIATAETGGVPAPGPTYWTVYGVVTDIIEDYGTTEEQAAIFGMTASLQTQLDVVSRFAADHGFGGWGQLTKQKCGL